MLFSLIALALGFAALVAWVLLPRNRQRFAEASRLPFTDAREPNNDE
jgi:cbb3-type cytochrome oxidase subunit 3